MAIKDQAPGLGKQESIREVSTVGNEKASAAELALRRLLAQRPLRFDPARPGSLAQRYGGSARALALIELFYGRDSEWRHGALVAASELKSRSAPSDEELRGLLAPNNWQDPAAVLGESDIDGFLANNPAAKAFSIALSRQLGLARIAPERVAALVRDAVARMHPQYLESLRERAMRIARDGDNRLPMPRWTPCPHPDAPALNVPMDARPDFLALALEAMDLAFKATGRDLGAEDREEWERSKKQCDKARKALKKIFAGKHPTLFGKERGIEQLDAFLQIQAQPEREIASFGTGGKKPQIHQQAQAQAPADAEELTSGMPLATTKASGVAQKPPKQELPAVSASRPSKSTKAPLKATAVSPGKKKPAPSVKRASASPKAPLALKKKAKAAAPSAPSKAKAVKIVAPARATAKKSGLKVAVAKKKPKR